MHYWNYLTLNKTEYGLIAYNSLSGQSFEMCSMSYAVLSLLKERNDEYSVIEASASVHLSPNEMAEKLLFLRDFFNGNGMKEQVNGLVRFIREDALVGFQITFDAALYKLSLPSLFTPKVIGVFIGLTLSLLLVAAMQEAFSTVILFSASTYWILCLLALSTLWHELGHIQAAKEYGLKRISIGAGIYYFFPVLFTDMTSAYLLERPKRLVIGLAGIYFEWIYALILLVCFQIWGAQVFAQAGLVVLIKSLYNLNPFFKTDGYWVLSDFLQIHQLRDSAYQCLGRFLVDKNTLLKNERTLWLYALAHLSFYAVFTIFLIQRLTAHLQQFFAFNRYEVDLGTVKIGGLLVIEFLAFFHLFKLILQAIYSLPEYLATVTKN